MLIVVTLGVCYFAHLGAIGFVGPDEPRYAWIARDMAETGDWVTPRLYGKPWFEKPPLYYWCAAVSFKLFGVSETAARLPSAVAALLATLSLAWLGLRLYGAETARWLLLLLPTSVGMIGFSHAASTDMLFSATLSLVLVAGCVGLRLVPGLLWLGLLSFGFFLGLAVLAKGPAAVILLGGAVFFWALFTKRWRDAFRLFHPLALAAFFFTALPWYILCARRNPDFFRIFIIEHNFKRYLTPEFQHIQPFWYYAAVLLIAFLPWTALFLWSLITGSIRLARARCTAESTCLLLCWSAFCVLFFTISKSKLPGYVLPAIPAICLLVVRVRWALAIGKVKRLALSILTAALVFAAAYVLLGSLTLHLMRGPTFNAGIAVGWILAALSAANLLLGAGIWRSSRARTAAVLAPCAVLPVLAAVMVSERFVPAFSIWDPSGRTIARELGSVAIPPGELLVRQMRRGQRYSLSFYLRQEVLDWDPQHPREGFLLTGSRPCGVEPSSGLICEEVLADLKKSDRFLYRIRQKSVGAAGSGETK